MRPNLLPPLHSLLRVGLSRCKFEAARWAIEKGARPTCGYGESIRAAIRHGDVSFLNYLINDKHFEYSDIDMYTASIITRRTFYNTLLLCSENLKHRSHSMSRESFPPLQNEE